MPLPLTAQRVKYVQIVIEFVGLSFRIALRNDVEIVRFSRVKNLESVRFNAIKYSWYFATQK